MVDAILIENQRVGERADLQQACRSSVVSRQVRDKAHDDAGMAYPHMGDQAMKVFTPSCRRARLTLIVSMTII